jgi:hypothetical protein
MNYRQRVSKVEELIEAGARCIPRGLRLKAQVQGTSYPWVCNLNFFLSFAKCTRFVAHRFCLDLGNCITISNGTSDGGKRLVFAIQTVSLS